MKKGAIFDMDGTMFDTERLYEEAWMALPPKYGYESDPVFPKEVCGTTGERMYIVARKFYPGIDVESFCAECRAYVDASLKKEVPMKPGIREILDYFREKNVPLAIASSGRPSKIRHCLDKTGLGEYFPVIVSGKDVKESKPSPEIFLLAAEKLGLPPEDCYVFEDGRNGILAGAAAGCTTVMIPDLTEPTEELRQVVAGIYPDLFAVKDALESGEI